MDNTVHANAVNVSGFYNLEATSDVVPYVVFRASHWRPDAGMDGLVADQPFLMSEVEKRPMVYSAETQPH